MRRRPEASGRRGAAVCAVALALAVLLSAGPTRAQPRGLELRIDNDQFAFTRGEDERWYTSGAHLALAILPDPRAPDARLAAAWCARLIACDRDARPLRLLSVGHAIHTPAFTGRLEPQPLDRPYAATLHGGLAVVVQGAATRQTLELRLGAVGPAALGEGVQNGLHALIGQERARGWGFQTRAQPLLELAWSRLSRHRLGWVDGAEAVLRGSLQLGTPVTQAGLGALFVAGSAVTAPHWPGETGLAGAAPRGWRMHAGFEVRWVGRDALIDADTYGYRSQVRREWLVGDLLVGAALGIGDGWSVEAALVLRSVPFDTPDPGARLRPQRFGTIALRRHWGD